MPIRIVAESPFIAQLIAMHLYDAQVPVETQNWVEAEATEQAILSGAPNGPSLYVLTTAEQQQPMFRNRLAKAQGNPLVLLDQRVDVSFLPDGMPEHASWVPWPSSIQAILAALGETSTIQSTLTLPVELGMLDFLALVGPLQLTATLDFVTESETWTALFYNGKICGLTAQLAENRLCRDERFLAVPSLASGLRFQSKLGGNPQEDLKFQRLHLDELDALPAWKSYCAQAFSQGVMHLQKMYLSPLERAPRKNDQGLPIYGVLLSILTLLDEAKVVSLLPHGAVISSAEVPMLLENVLPQEDYGALFFALSSSSKIGTAIQKSGMERSRAIVALALAALTNQIFALPNQESAAYIGGAPSTALPQTLFQTGSIDFHGFEKSLPSGVIWMPNLDSTTSALADKPSFDELLRTAKPRGRAGEKNAVEPRRPRPAYNALLPLQDDWAGPLPERPNEPVSESQVTLPPSTFLPVSAPPPLNQNGLVAGTRYRPIWEPFGLAFDGYAMGQSGPCEIHVAVRRLQNSLRLVTLKKLLPQYKGRRDLASLLQTEGQIGALFNHPAIVDTVGVGLCKGEAYCLQQFVHGISLSAFLRAMRELQMPVPSWLCCAVGLDIASALHQAATLRFDDAPIVHRDLHPGNVILGFDGHTRVTNFGFALRDPRKQPSILAYTAPEVFARETPSPKVDQFALGAILYEMLTGFVCFARRTAEETLYALQTGDIAPIESLRPDAPSRLVAVIMRCISPDPRDRFESPAALHQALQETDCLHTSPAPQIAELCIKIFGSVRTMERGALAFLLEACREGMKNA